MLHGGNRFTRATREAGRAGEAAVALRQEGAATSATRLPVWQGWTRRGTLRNAFGPGSDAPRCAINQAMARASARSLGRF